MPRGTRREILLIQFLRRITPPMFAGPAAPRPSMSLERLGPWGGLGPGQTQYTDTLAVAVAVVVLL